MSHQTIDIAVLKTLAATAEQQKEHENFGISKFYNDASLGINQFQDCEIEALIKEEEDQVRKEATRNAVREIIKVTKLADSELMNNFVKIKQYNAAIADARRRVNELVLARAYGVDTRNYLPLIKIIFPQAASIPGDTIPAEWRDKNEAMILNGFKENAKASKAKTKKSK